MLNHGLVVGAVQSRQRETVPPILIKHLTTKVKHRDSAQALERDGSS